MLLIMLMAYGVQKLQTK